MQFRSILLKFEWFRYREIFLIDIPEVARRRICDCWEEVRFTLVPWFRFCSVDPIDLFSVFLRTVRRVEVANCTYFGQVELLRARVPWLSHSSFQMMSGIVSCLIDTNDMIGWESCAMSTICETWVLSEWWAVTVESGLLAKRVRAVILWLGWRQLPLVYQEWTFRSDVVRVVTNLTAEQTYRRHGLRRARHRVMVWCLCIRWVNVQRRQYFRPLSRTTGRRARDICVCAVFAVAIVSWLADIKLIWSDLLSIVPRPAAGSFPYCKKRLRMKCDFQ